jgi:GntR family transcriptional repressor for pyruvate dehydrogenase complex
MATGSRQAPRSDRRGAQGVVDVIREWIERGKLKRGDQLPPERDLALQLGISRPTVRAGLRSLVTMGVLESRHGMGTFITNRPPALGSESLSLLASLHGFTADDMFVARRVLEVAVASLAAQCATPADLAAMSEEVTGMFAALDSRQEFLAHDFEFHRAIAAASGNPVLAALVQMVSTLVAEQRAQSLHRMQDLKETAQVHLRIYQAIRARDPEAAGALMKEHLLLTRPRDGAARPADTPRPDAVPAVPSPSSVAQRRARNVRNRGAR